MPGNRVLTPIALADVQIEDRFWAPRLEAVRRVTLAEEYEQLRETGRIEALRLNWRPGQPNPPHIFWDSDVAKWVEAASYSLITQPDAQLAAKLDEVVDLFAAAQQPDGYLNSHFTVVEPEKRWTNLRDWHELYCAGHIIEAAVAHHQATGSDKLLRVACRYADYISTVFGREPGKKRGYCGHEEIELALVRLYRATGERRYLDLARYFVDERGRQPHYFDQEARARGEDPAGDWHGHDYRYNQSHLPVREQTSAEGHAVRAMYLYCAMADLAGETGDASLLEACRRLWQSVSGRRMYITGGIGSSARGERFTWDYDLPNASAYAETCAAIGLVFWAHRLLQVEPKAEYADVMERALYNGVLSGISLDGSRFFYVNPLEVDYQAYLHEMDLYGTSSIVPQRQGWFSCACCPPNIARLLTSLGSYALSAGDDRILVHLYLGGRMHASLAGGKVSIAVESRYPWEGRVRLEVTPEVRNHFTLGLRLPGWCRRPELSLNGRQVDLAPLTRDGYCYLERDWQAGDLLELELPMAVERMVAHPEVTADVGRVALQRGPLVYCFEQADNGPRLQQLRLPRDAGLAAAYEPSLLGGVVAIEGQALRSDPAAWHGGLYSRQPATEVPVPVRAIPYYAWANREPGDMLVWIRGEA